MEFLSEYYLWFIIGGIILVMAVIGYIADKTDFGRKNKIAEENNKLKEEKTDNKNFTESSGVMVEEVSPQEPIVNDVVETSELINEVVVPTIEEPVIDDFSMIIDEPIINENTENIQLEENKIEQPVINDISDISVNDETKEVIDDSAYVLNNDLSSFAAGTISESAPVSPVVEEVINEQDNDDEI